MTEGDERVKAARKGVGGSWGTNGGRVQEGGCAMNERRVLRITASGVEATAVLHATKTADAIWAALPIEGRAGRWGEEIYFSIGISLDSEDGREVVDVLPSEAEIRPRRRVRRRLRRTREDCRNEQRRIYKAGNVNVYTSDPALRAGSRGRR
jgi:hypothetical protein